MSRKRRRKRRLPPSRKPRYFSDSPRRSPGAPARSTRDYRTEEFISALMQAETGIYESFIVSERELTDADVERDLRCDMYPEHTPTSWAEEVRKQAQEEAQRITNAAHREAAAIHEKARLKEEEVAQKRLRLHNDLKKMVGELY